MILLSLSKGWKFMKLNATNMRLIWVDSSHTLLQLSEAHLLSQCRLTNAVVTQRSKLQTMPDYDAELLIATAGMKQSELAKAVTLLTCIREVLGSNLCLDTNCRD
jgi:hypothetical protein